MKTIVVYYSLEGNTKFTAKKIAEKLNADIMELKPVKAYPTGKVSKYFWCGKSASFQEKPELEPYQFHPEEYDTVIIGTPLWAGKITPPIRTFLSSHDFSGKRVAAFITCGGGNAQKAFDSIKKEIGLNELTAEAAIINPLKNKNISGKGIEEFCNKITK